MKSKESKFMTYTLLAVSALLVTATWKIEIQTLKKLHIDKMIQSVLFLFQKLAGGGEMKNLNDSDICSGVVNGVQCPTVT